MLISLLESEGKKSTKELFIEKMAQTSTRYPQDATVSLSLNCTSALDSLVALLISSYFAPWQTETLVRSIGQQAFHHRYEGEWANVQLLLENEDQSPQKLEEKVLEVYGPRTYYGNLLPRALVVLRRIKFKDTTKKNTKPVRRTQRIRGYRDKGSRRLPHEFHGDPPEGSEQEDRRALIRHPLLFDKEKQSSYQNRVMPGNTAAIEGGEQE